MKMLLMMMMITMIMTEQSMITMTIKIVTLIMAIMTIMIMIMMMRMTKKMMIMMTMVIMLLCRRIITICKRNSQFFGQILSLITFHKNTQFHKINSSTICFLFYGRDAPAAPQPGENLYGVHPVYMVVEETGEAHMVLWLNSNAMGKCCVLLQLLYTVQDIKTMPCTIPRHSAQGKHIHFLKSWGGGEII